MNGTHSYSVNSGRLKTYIAIGLISALITPIVNNLVLDMRFLKDLQPWISTGPSFAGVYAFVYFLFNKYIWKWKVIRFTGLNFTPNLNGTYKGEITSSYKPKNKTKLKLTITQSWNRIVVYMLTTNDTSESYSYMASILVIDSNIIRLSYSYTNKPFNAIADADMKAHEGTVDISFHSNGKVLGTYFNSRERIGSLNLKKVISNT